MDDIYFTNTLQFYVFKGNLYNALMRKYYKCPTPSCSHFTALTTGHVSCIPSPTSVRSLAPAQLPLVHREKPQSSSQSPLATRAEMTGSSFASLKNSDTVKADTWLLANHVFMKGTWCRRDETCSCLCVEK